MIYTETKLKPRLTKDQLILIQDELNNKLFSLKMESNRMRNCTWVGDTPPWVSYDQEIQDTYSLLNQIENRLEKLEGK